jgi:hypothetical protein
MLYRLGADAVVVLHLAFVVFALLGGLAVLRWRWVAWLHIPAAVWAVLIEFAGWYCPLTPLENRLRRLGGEAGYTGGFVEHYLMPILYPDGLTREIQIALGTFALILNLTIYAYILLRIKRGQA